LAGRGVVVASEIKKAASMKRPFCFAAPANITGAVSL
jgi:hypothetical protein